MSKFKVKITRTETTTREVEVEAADAEAAKKTAQENDMKGEYNDLFDANRPDRITSTYKTKAGDTWYDWRGLSGEDWDEVQHDSARRRWGYSKDDLTKEVDAFAKAMEKGDVHATSMICARLEDCNYHSICGALAYGDLTAARRDIKEIYG